MVRGDDARIVVEGKANVLSFFTSRLVNADDLQHASSLALQEVESLPEFQAIRSNSGRLPRLSIEEAEVVSSDELGDASSTGLVFFDPAKP